MKMASIAYILFLCLTLAASANDQNAGGKGGNPSTCISLYSTDKNLEDKHSFRKCLPIELLKATEIDNLVKIHITNSYHYLFLSSTFGNYKKNRIGFKKLYRKLSDQHWEDAIEIIKYAAKKGHRIDINALKFEITREQNNLMQGKDLELPSLLMAFDLHHDLTTYLHSIVKKHADVDMRNYLEDHYLEKHTKSIRDLSGHIHDLKNFFSEGLPVFLFDEYLQSVY